jgi:hypothetical protein
MIGLARRSNRTAPRAAETTASTNCPIGAIGEASADRQFGTGYRTCSVDGGYPREKAGA